MTPLLPRHALAVFRSQKKDTLQIARDFCLTEAEVYRLIAEARDNEQMVRGARVLLNGAGGAK